LLIAFVTETKLTIALSSPESLQAASWLPDGRGEKKFKKKFCDGLVNLLKQLLFSRLNSSFQGHQISSKQLPVLHHNMLATL